MEGEAIHEGFRVRVLSALADSTTTTVYAEITDLTGDRLKSLQEFDFSGDLDIKLEGENHWSWGTDTLSYDPETKTALVTLTRYMGGNSPVQLMAPSPSTTFNPAAVGYGSDGRFHTLFRLPDEAILELSGCHAIPQTPPTPERANPFWGATKGESGKSDWPKDGSYDINVANFIQDGKKYHDLSYVRRPGGPELPEHLEPLFACIITEETVEGHGSFPSPSSRWRVSKVLFLASLTT